MAQFTVTIPIAGHAVVVVDADDRESAVQKAFDELTVEHLEDWEGLNAFNQGNVCHCPSPWELVVEDEDGNEVEE